MPSGMVFNIQKYSIHDGPGIRTTIFLKGCPLRCEWCHNPEGQSPEPELAFWPSRCLVDCSECVSGCEQLALAKADSVLTLDRKKCNLCGQCVDICPSRALEMAGRRLNVEEVMAELAKDQIFQEESGGGVTFSGGEPFFQPEFLQALLEESAKRGIHTAVDTCGVVETAVLEKLSPRINLFLYDLKIMDEEKHRQLTGASNRIVLENLRWLDERARPIQVRMPLIPGVNDGPEDIDQLVCFLRSLKHVHQVALLPYHDLGREKYGRFNLESKAKKIPLPTPELIKSVKEKLESSGIEVRIGG